MRTVLTSLWRAGVVCLLLYGTAAMGAVPPLVRNGDSVRTGVFLNGDGVLAVPTRAGDSAEWTVEYEGERYPATTLGAPGKSGMALLQIRRQKAFTPAPVSQRQASSFTRLVLVGMAADKREITADVVLTRVRRRVPELDLEGSYYEINIVGDAPLDGAVLTDPATGDAYGMLVAPSGSSGTRYVLFGSTISDRAAAANAAIGETDVRETRRIVFRDGRSAPARVRLLEFRAAAGAQHNTQRARAVQEWRNNTGFWINSFTSPEVRGEQCYFGATNGLLYCVDLKRMQRVWAFDNRDPVFSPPSVATGQIITASGGIVMRAWQEAEADFLTFLTGLPNYRTRRGMAYWGVINCVDPVSGTFKWSHETRFVGQPVVAGSRVLYAGMGIFGAVNLDDGKLQWEQDAARDSDKPTHYTIAGADDKRVWMLNIPAELKGDASRLDPFRLEQREDARVECYLQEQPDAAKVKPLWSVPIKKEKNVPALSSSLLMTPDRKMLFGATAKSLFAVDPEAGTLLWQKPLFSQLFAGSLAYNDGVVLATGTDNSLHAVSGVDGTVLWSFAGARGPLCQPVAAEGIVYVGSIDTWIYALDIRTGELVWKFETDGKICGRPQILENKLYAMADDGRLLELELPQ